MPKVTPVAIHGDLSDDSELAPEFEAETETAVAVAEPVELIDHTALENFIASYGPNRLASAQAWIAATGIDASDLHNALRDRVLSLVSRPSAADNHRREFGLMATDFAAWAKRNKIPYALTQVARTALNTPVAEAVETRSLWSLATAVEALGVDCGALRDAIQQGQLRNISDPNSCASISRIEPGSLLRWITSRGEPIRLSLEFASFLTRTRHQASAVEQSGPNIIDEALDSLASELAADEADTAANLKSMRASYVAILRRRNESLPGDERDLVELARQLGLNRAAMERDAAVLEAADALTHQVGQIELATTELEAAGEASTELKARHKLEADESRARLRNAQAAHAIAVRAPFELESLKASRPELFDQ